jgi:hypothetical protein
VGKRQLGQAGQAFPYVGHSWICSAADVFRNATNDNIKTDLNQQQEYALVNIQSSDIYYEKSCRKKFL